MTRGADDPDEGADEAPRAERRRRRRRARADAPKEKVLHTRVPAVLDEELKRLAENLRVPVSNVVRAILEDALDAVDSVSERAEDELLGFADRLSRRRDELRHRVEREGEGREGRDDGPEPPAPRGADASESVEAPPCPAA
ncbi:MAG TPA: hypothetical protein RMH99_13880, partial [Sandaracinaceae bacterium LLY-WYZ-13_1]|nr:hypothetical protein [Sandaracinaceae bacterium LLY-WYZ-13_1]